MCYWLKDNKPHSIFNALIWQSNNYFSFFFFFLFCSIHTVLAHHYQRDQNWSQSEAEPGEYMWRLTCIFSCCFKKSGKDTPKFCCCLCTGRSTTNSGVWNVNGEHITGPNQIRLEEDKLALNSPAKSWGVRSCRLQISKMIAKWMIFWEPMKAAENQGDIC